MATTLLLAAAADQMIKVDPVGNLVWAKDYSGFWVMGKSIRTMDGGALVVAENGLDSTMGSGRLVLIKLDSQGAVTWSRSYADGFGWSFNSAQLAKPLQTRMEDISFRRISYGFPRT